MSENSRMRKTLALSFDLENVLSGPADWVLPVMEQLVALLEKYDARATFFVVGDMVDTYPELIRTLHAKGHEIGCHAARRHTELTKLTPQQFSSEIEGVAVRIERLVGKRPVGYRAARFSLSDETKWALPVLAERGFRYDSSIVPVGLGEYGISGAPVSLYKISFNSLTTVDPMSPLFEVPISIGAVGSMRVPFVCGGVFFRFFPGAIFRLFLRWISRSTIPVLYFHPHDFYGEGGAHALAHLDSPEFLKRHSHRFLRNVGLKKSFKKLERLLQSYEGKTIEDAILNNS